MQISRMWVEYFPAGNGVTSTTLPIRMSSFSKSAIVAFAPSSLIGTPSLVLDGSFVDRNRRFRHQVHGLASRWQRQLRKAQSGQTSATDSSISFSSLRTTFCSIDYLYFFNNNSSSSSNIPSGVLACTLCFNSGCM